MLKTEKTIYKLLFALMMSFTFFGIAKVFKDNYLISSSGFMQSGFMVLLFIALCPAKFIWKKKALILLLTPVLYSCNYAKSNQQVVVSADCGMTWKKINAGDAVPKGVGNYCYMKVVMPNFPMQGDSRFITNLKDRVRAFVHIDYDYSITDPLAFIKQAKYLGKANSNADDGEALDPSAFEGAENMVIDKRIRDISKDLFITEDIVELDQSELENRLFDASNKVLEQLGVHLNFITLTFDLDEQTRQAIDVSTAMKIYESKGLTDVGKQVMISRAGATKVNIENKLPSQAVEEK
ncbi:hypothetical protein [Emticicia sp. C21]|uniref:hypothetical protein n=1 Tax=Emticicia sp. C21 TaxID=2302915 RepID=UPI000E34D5F4|nr:hypothetical protein [Emticicia sp. C21]RFS15212.1 hypothetical protein D0T08_16935 [Emticicia sp. C21]